MNTKRVAILGAGISGLASAYFMQKYHPDAECVLFEKESFVGGVIQSSRKDGIFFEHGPRTFATNRTPNLLQLIKELGLEPDMIFSSAKNRYVLRDGSIARIPDNLFRLLCSPFGRGVITGILKDLRHPPGLLPDESIESFVLRHGNKKVLEQLVDPMVTGIFAGDSSKLSVGACFPNWKKLEYKYGSVLKGLFNAGGKSSLPPLYSLKGGMHSLPEKLAQEITCETRFGTAITSLVEKERGVEVNGEYFDHAILCLPSYVLKTLVPEKYRPFFTGIENISLSVVNIAFDSVDIPTDGFGYLAPKKEKADIFGVIFDSSVFPELHTKDRTRVSVLMPGEENFEARALDALRDHLNIHQTPMQLHVHSYKNYLPHLLVGHLERRDLLSSPNLSFVGNYLHSVSVESCITEAAHAVKHGIVA